MMKGNEVLKLPFVRLSLVCILIWEAEDIWFRSNWLAGSVKA